MLKQVEANRDGVINPQSYNFKHEKILMFSQNYELTEVDRRTRLDVPSGSLVHQQRHSPIVKVRHHVYIDAIWILLIPISKKMQSNTKQMMWNQL